MLDYECMSGYKSAALDLGPSNLLRCGSTSRKAIDQACEPESSREYQSAPSGIKRGRASAEHVSAAQNKVRHVGVSQYLTSSVFLCHLCSWAHSICYI